MGPHEAYAKYAPPLFTVAVVLGLAAVAFIKDSLDWVQQIKTCPKWMWRTALSLGVYAIVILCIEVIWPKAPSLLDQGLTVSCFPLAFDAIYLCILWSVLRSGYLERSEVVRRAMHSVGIVTLGIIVFLACRGGYLHHPKNN